MILSNKRMCILKLVAKSSYLNLKVANQVSSKKFHELSEKFDLTEMINPIPEDNILSKYLSDSLSLQKPKPSSTATSTSKKTHLPYAQTLEKNPHGSIVSKKYKDTEFLMIGMNYQNLAYSQLFKTIMKFEPDCIMVQARPELFNKEFNIMKKGQDGIFSDRLYIEQLQINKTWNIPSPSHITSAQSLIFPRKSATPHPSHQPTLHPCLPLQPLPLKPLLTSLYYSTKHPTPTYLSQLPELISRQHIASSNSLMQLQELFKQVAKSMALYPGVPMTPMKLAMYMFPEVFMRKNDLYQATLVEILIAMGKFKKVLVLNGQVENQVIVHILENDLLVDQNQEITPLLTHLIPAPIKSSILRQFQPLELLEKHIILDTLYYGHNSTTVPLSSLTTTNKVIAQYLSKQPKQLIFKFRYEMMLKYSELLKEYEDKGKSLKKKQFVRAALKY